MSPPICYPHRWLSPHLDAPVQTECDGLSQFLRGHRRTLCTCLRFNIIICWKPDSTCWGHGRESNSRHTKLPRGAGKRWTHALLYQPRAREGDEPMPFRTSQPGSHCTVAPRSLDHWAMEAGKTYRVLGIIKQNFIYMDEHTFVLLYMVCPHVKFGNSVWCPFKVGDIEETEKIQKRATKLITSLKNKPYKERLMHLKLPTLKFRWRRGDMIEVFKLTHNIYKW